MVEVYFGNIATGTGRSAGKKLFQRCLALPFEYVQSHADSPVQVVVVRQDRMFVLGKVSSLLQPAPAACGLPLYAPAPASTC